MTLPHIPGRNKRSSKTPPSYSEEKIGILSTAQRTSKGGFFHFDLHSRALGEADGNRVYPQYTDDLRR